MKIEEMEKILALFEKDDYASKNIKQFFQTCSRRTAILKRRKKSFLTKSIGF